MPASRPRIALFVTCLVDLYRPQVGFASLKLLADSGADVAVPGDQVCCGQPAYNAGDRAAAQAIARDVIALFEAYDRVVVPSGSCAGMLRRHYPELLAHDAAWAARARDFAAKVSELSEYLARQGLTLRHRLDARICYHHSCGALRDMEVQGQPLRLLEQIAGLTITEAADREACCGFGGTFCVKFPELATRLADDKLADLQRDGADLLVSGDLGCLLHLAGRAARRGDGVRVYHLAEVLADALDAEGLEAGG